MEGYKCDFCGKFFPGKACYTVRHRDGSRRVELRKGDTVIATNTINREYDACCFCWDTIAQPVLENVRFKRSEEAIA